MRPPRRGRHRGFTIIEVILAAVLGAAVVLASMTLFTAMTRTERRTSVRDFGQKELSRLNIAVRKAVSQIVVLGFAPKPKAPPSTPTARPVDQPEDLAEADEPQEPETWPRVILEPDPLIGLQRLELVVAEAPVLGGADGRTLEPDAGKRFSMARGAFVIRPSIGTLPADVQEAILPGTPVYDVWWLPVDRLEEGMPVVGRPEGVIVARGLSQVRWRFFKSDENAKLQPLTTASATARSELPAYFEMDVTTVQGHRANWMFEVGWTVQMPESLPESKKEALSRARAAAGSGTEGFSTTEPFSSSGGIRGGGGGPRGGGKLEGRTEGDPK